MFAVIILFETAGRNLLLGFMPEPLGLLVFGVALVTTATGLRRFFNRKDVGKTKENRCQQKSNT